MKTTLLTKMFASLSTGTAAFVCCLTFLLASARTGQAQFGLAWTTSSTNAFNFYAYNGITLAVDGTNLSTAFSGQPRPPYPEWPGINSGPIPRNGLVAVNATAVTGSASFTLGSNPTGAGGMTLTLYNPNAIPDEVRLDWNALYTNNGSATPIIGFVANISGTGTGAGSFFALAGGETIYSGVADQGPGGGTFSGGTMYTAFLDNSFTHAGLGAGPWYGMTGPGVYSASPVAYFSPSGLSVPQGGAIRVYGYLDLVVDPGTIQVQLQALPPALGIGVYSNLPVVFFPTATGTNYAVQMSTNLGSGNWVTVTNGVPFSGLQITNAPSPAFFRLQ